MILPQYLTYFGGLINDRTFESVNKKLAKIDGGAGQLYPVLSLRFWCHAHIYSPVLGLIFYLIIHPKDGSQPQLIMDIALTLLTVSFGSLSFAVFDSFGGAHADKRGCKSAIRLGLWLMILLMVYFAVVTGLYHQLDFPVHNQPHLPFIILWVIGQVLIGIPLALIDGADTQLTNKITQKFEEYSDVKSSTDEMPPSENDEDLRWKKADSNYLEAICVKLKYSGIALTSFIGCLIFVVFNSWLKISLAIVGPLLFLITIAGQILALRLLRQVNETKKISPPHAFRVVIRLILDDNVLLTWILIIAVTEGWLLFATYYFQLDALRKLIESASNASTRGISLILLFIIPVLYWLLSKMASFGGSFFNSWHQRAARATVSGSSQFIQLRHGTILDIPQIRLAAAAYILAIMVGLFILHLVQSALFSQQNNSAGPAAYTLSLIPLAFFAGYQFLRGFAHPLLKTTLTNLTESRSVQHTTTLLSLSAAAGRTFHAISASLFAILLLLQRNAQGGGLPPSTQALTGTIVSVMLTIFALNILCGLALDRSPGKDLHEPIFFYLPWREINSMLHDRVFRSYAIKGTFFVCLALSNILALKLCHLGGLVFNAGAIPYALTFILVETVAETESKASARKLWLAGISTYFVAALLVYAAIKFPAGLNPESQRFLDNFTSPNKYDYVSLFDKLFWRGPFFFIIASLCSFAVAQYLDIWLFLLIRRATAKRLLWLRSNLSTFISQIFDTVIFIVVLAFLQSSTLSETGQHLIGQLGVKWIFSIVGTLLLYITVWWVEKGRPLPPD